MHKVNLNRLTQALLCLLVLVSSTCMLSSTEYSEQKEVWITVFVHGIMSIKPHLSINNFIRFMNDNVQKSVYARTVELMRDDPFYYRNQAMQDLGLIQIDPTQKQMGNSPSAFVNLLDQLHIYSNGSHVKNYYYTFGWSGLMSPTERYLDGKKLFVSLEGLLYEFHKHNIYPKIRIVGYSHGGNVVLNLGAARQKDFPDSMLSIDETILLGMPVQVETDYLINDPIFKKIYHLYSSRDRIQALDFFSYKRFFSRKKFKKRRGFILPEKLTQIQLKVMRPTIKVQNDPIRFKRAMNLTTPGIISGRSHMLRDVSPGHCELWFFGWSPHNYRDNYPLYPLPVIAALPFITNYMPTIADQVNPNQSVIFDIRPDHELILIKNHKTKAIYKTLSFVPQAQMHNIKNQMLEYLPQDLTGEAHNIHVLHALELGQLLYEQENPPKTKRRARKRKRVEKSKRKYLVPNN